MIASHTQDDTADKGKRRFLPAGGHGLVVSFDDALSNTGTLRDNRDPATRKARALARRIQQAAKDGTLTGIVDLIPGLTNLLVQYDPLQTSAKHVQATITPWLNHLSEDSGNSRHIRIPCCYGGEFGPDLESIAVQLNLTPDEIVARHVASSLEVAIMGFLPGLAYMKGVDETLYLPRRKTPRALVPALTLGIAMDQTVVYPMPSPGGWNLIGRIPIALFDPKKDNPVLLRPGDNISFYQIDINEYNEIYEAYHSGRFSVEIT